MTDATARPPAPRPEVLDFLLTRRSHPARLLAGPAPDTDTLARLLTAAARVPDHGKLEPWRFLVVQGAARARIAAEVAAQGAAAGVEAERLDKDLTAWREAPVTVAVIAVPRPTDRIPEWEQVLSAGAVCLSLVNAALAQGLGACWLTGFADYDPEVGARSLGLAPGERVAGFVHIGASPGAPPDRPRPTVDAITTWVSA